MLVLVTGSTGFIGSQLCRALVAVGHQVRAFHRPSSSQAALKDVEVEHALGDITQPETLTRAMQGVEVVFHTAAILGKPSDPRQMYTVTVGGTRNVLEVARQAGVRRVIHTSSVAALGVPVETHHAVSNPLMDEHHTWNSRPDWWRYGHTKYLAEMEVQRAVAHGLDVVIVNPAVVIGAGDLNRISGDVVVRMALRQVPVSVAGGSNVVHIADVVRGHLVALSKGRTGERYILGGENLTHRQLLEIIAKVADVPPPLVNLPTRLVRFLIGPLSLISRWLPLPVSADSLHRVGLHFYYDTRKARQELELDVTRSAREAVEDAYIWYRDMGMIKG